MWRDSESEQDFLNFTEVADQVAALVSNESLLPISVGVFGGWGTGKSTVLRLVEGRLPPANGGGPIVVKFDAWTYQGFDDARAALMEVVSEALLSLAEEKKTLVDKAKEFAGRVNYFRGLGMIADFSVGVALGIPPGLLTSAGAAVSSIFSGAGTTEDVAEIKKDAAAARKGLSDLVRPAEKRTPPKEIAAFRKEFGDLLEGLGASLVLFIDNLDRCLPDVAIQTLEAVRLFLFMPRTAFVIAADEGMIRHSVARHFNDPNVSHVRDYLDKVIQVPLRVPQVGPEDLRAYMYSLFVGLAAPAKLGEVQKRLLAALQGGWRGDTFERDEIAELAGDPEGLRDNLAIADRLAPILAGAPNIQGNPRIVKRLLNAIFLRRLVAKTRNMNVDLAMLAKLAVFERCTDEKASLALYRIVHEGEAPERWLLPPGELKGDTAPDIPNDWKPHSDFIAEWQQMDPLFGDVTVIKAAVFLSRDVMAPARSRDDASAAVRDAVAALLKVDSINSPVGKQVVEHLSAQERRTAMSRLVDTMRPGDWSQKVAGLHGAIILSQASPEAANDLKAFVGTLPKASMDKGSLFLLRQAKLIEG